MEKPDHSADVPGSSEMIGLNRRPKTAPSQVKAQESHGDSALGSRPGLSSRASKTAEALRVVELFSSAPAHGVCGIRLKRRSEIEEIEDAARRSPAS